MRYNNFSHPAPLTTALHSSQPFRWRSALQAAQMALLALACLLVAPFLSKGANAQELDAPATNPAMLGSTLDLEDYWQLVEETRDQAAWAKNHPDNEIQPAFLQAANLWENLESVRLPDGTHIPIDTSAIVTGLRADPPDAERLETLLNTMLEQRQSWPAGPFGINDLQKLEEILAKPEYQWSEEAPPSPLEEWIARQFERFMNWLFETLEGRITSSGLRIWQLVLIGLGALALAFVLAYLGRNLRKVAAAEAGLGSDDHFEENLSPGAALSKAQAMSSNGDFRMAVRYLYLAALLQLEERGLLRYDRSKTNREYLGDIQRRTSSHTPALLDSFADVVEVFDRVWYGYQPIDLAGYENYAASVARIAELRQQQ